MKKTVSTVILIAMLLSSLTLFVNGYKKGDFNGDGKINAVDASYMTRLILGTQNVRTQSRADFNSDNKVNAVDMSLMCKYFVGQYEIGTPVGGGFYAETSDAEQFKTYLSNRIGKTDDDVVLGIGDCKAYGIDMSDYEEDGYLIRNNGVEVLLFAKSAAGLDRATRAYAKAVEAEEQVTEIQYHRGYRIKEMQIFGTNLSEYTVLVTDTSNGNMVFAASELSRLLEKATGVSLPVVNGTTNASHVIEFRISDSPDLEYDGYSYFCEGDRLVIEAAKERGCMYGVWRFLENECGWVELSFGDSNLRCADLVSIDTDVYKTETPGTKYLNMYQETPPPISSFMNEKGTPGAGQSGCNVLSMCMHGMQSNMWAGVDVSVKQMCYTNKTNIQKTKENIAAYLNTYKEAIGKSIISVDIAQGDNSDYCVCRVCNNVKKEEGGTNAGAVLRFANEICEYFEADYPDLKFQIFAYAGSNIPPTKTKAHKNVSVTFCYDFSCSNHPLDGSECVDGFTSGVPDDRLGRTNGDMDKWLRGWCNISQNVCVWYYALDCGLMGYPVIDTILSDFKYLYGLGVTAIFWQMQNYGFGTARIQYLLANQVYWNPDMTEEEYRDYYELYMAELYGEGWQYIDRYIDTWTEAHDRMGCWHCWGGFTSPWSMRLDAEYIGEHFEENLELFDKALALAEDTRIETNIKLLSLQMYFQGIYGATYNAIVDGTLNDKYERYKALYDHCIDLLTTYLYYTESVRAWDGATYILHHTYDGILKEWAGNYHDTFYRDVGLDKNNNISWQGKIIRQLVPET